MRKTVFSQSESGALSLGAVLSILEQTGCKEIVAIYPNGMVEYEA